MRALNSVSCENAPTPPLPPARSDADVLLREVRRLRICQYLLSEVMMTSVSRVGSLSSTPAPYTPHQPPPHLPRVVDTATDSLLAPAHQKAPAVGDFW